jgi:hypothetical protein
MPKQLEGVPAVVVHLASTSTVLIWCVYRLASELGITNTELLRRFGLNRLRGSWMGGALLILQLVGLGLVAQLQMQQGRWTFSADKFLSVNGEIDYVRSLEMVFLSPLREELIFRAIMFATIIRRYLCHNFDGINKESFDNNNICH